MDIILWITSPVVLVAHFLGGKKYLFEVASLPILQGSTVGLLPGLSLRPSPSCNFGEVQGLPSCLCLPHFLYEDMDFLSN